MKQGRRAFGECRIGGKAPKIQRSSCTPRRDSERWFWIFSSIYRSRIISITNDGSKSHGFHLQIAWLRRTSSWYSICISPGQHGRYSKITVKQTSDSHSSTEAEIISWMQDYGWTENTHLIYGIWSSQFFTGTRIRVIKHEETRINLQRERKFMERLMLTMLILFRRTWTLIVRSPTMRHVSRTHRVALYW